MADVCDETDVREAALLNADLSAIRARAQRIEPGSPGDCELCGEWFGRLVKGVCCPCRDKHKLP